MQVDGAQRVVNPLCTRAVPEMVAVPEPARVMVRATRQGQQSQQQSWLQFSAAMYLMKRSQARARLAEKYWRMKQIATKITLEVPMQRAVGAVCRGKGARWPECRGVQRNSAACGASRKARRGRVR